MSDNYTVEYHNEHACFHLTINLLNTKHQKYVVFKLGITFSSIDKSTIEDVLKFYNLDNIILESKNRQNTLYYVRIQDFESIDKIMSLINISSIDADHRSTSMNVFVDAYKIVKKIGHVHKEWKKEFVDLLVLKDQMNPKTRTRKGFTAKEWEDRIKRHFK
jgi:hypothetical protein